MKKKSPPVTRIQRKGRRAPTAKPTKKSDRGAIVVRGNCALCDKCWVYDDPKFPNWNGYCIYGGKFTAFEHDITYEGKYRRAPKNI